jgi:hypothetical protein
VEFALLRDNRTAIIAIAFFNLKGEFFVIIMNMIGIEAPLYYQLPAPVK